MNKSHERALGILRGVLALAVFGSTTALQAQTTSAAATDRPAATAVTPAKSHAEPVKPSESEAEAAQPEPNDRTHQGVKVHGHWAIDVKNPDGAVVKHVEFENSLVVGGNGDNLLAFALTGYLSAADWALSLNNANSSETALCGQVCYGVNSSTSLMGQMFCSGNSSSSCTTGTNVRPYIGGSFYVGGPVTSAYIKITGNITPTSSGNITSVQTLMAGCANYTLGTSYTTASLSPQACKTSTLSSLPYGTSFFEDQFTSASSFTPIPVVAGQIVSITVTISFS